MDRIRQNHRQPSGADRLRNGNSLSIPNLGDMAMMKKDYATGISFTSGVGFHLSDKRIAEMQIIIGTEIEDLDLQTDDKHYIVLAWPKLFTNADCFNAVTAAMHQLPVPMSFWSTDQGKKVINKFELYGHKTIKNIKQCFADAMAA
ncbi:MAG: hypothetical protein GY820_38670 [Gammaproteobacteria bacterium]|nr:hypothetical protein [Gammaproteobacteria bacterium]